MGRYTNTAGLTSHSVESYWMRCKICCICVCVCVCVCVYIYICYNPRRKAFQATHRINHFCMTHGKKAKSLPWQDRSRWQRLRGGLIPPWNPTHCTCCWLFSMFKMRRSRVTLMHNLFIQQFISRYWRTRSTAASMNHNCKYLMQEDPCCLLHYITVMYMKAI